MENWIPIFKTGTHMVSKGITSEWTESDLDRIARSYNPSRHEAPVVIGVPDDNSPAWGWVEKIRREGGTLFARFKDLVPEFAEMVREGKFRKRSISLHPDGTLRHVGFLGAPPPVIGGLPGVSFSDADEMTIEFKESEMDKWEDKWEKAQEKAAREAKMIEKIAELAARKMKTDKTLTYNKAFQMVVDENPDIAKKLSEIRADLIKDNIKDTLSQKGLEGLLEDVNFAESKREHLIGEYMEEHKDASYKEAVLAISKDHPELFRKA